MPDAPVRRPRIGIAYHQVAHYRRAVFDALARSDRYEFVVLSDTKPPDATIELVDPAETGWRWIVTPNVWVGPVLLWQRGLVREALFGRFDGFVMLGNFLYVSTWIAALAARLRGRRVLFWTHGWLRDEEPGVKGRLRRLFYRLADGLLVYGHWAKNIGLLQGFPAERIHVVYNSLDADALRRARERTSEARCDALRAELFADPGRPMLICSARLIPERRLDLLLEALARLRDAGTPANLLLIGDGPARAALEAEARTKGVDVRFYGACYDEDRLAELSMAASLTVMPGSIGLTAIQSLSFGVPVLTHDDRESQNPEWEVIVPGRTGGLFRRGDVDDLTRALGEWTRTPRPSEAVRKACLSMVDRFYNPAFQRRVIERALGGAPADDLFWQREPDETRVRTGGAACSSR